MQITENNANLQNKTTFGTKLGPNLSKYIKNNRSLITSNQKNNINAIKNNGLKDTTIDIIQDESGYDIFKLSGKNIDKKNSILENIFSDFFKNSKNISNYIRENNLFSIFVIKKDENKSQQVLNHFNTGYLNDCIIKENKLAEKVVNEFDIFMSKK